MKALRLTPLLLIAGLAHAQHLLHEFERVVLTDTYYSEGINAADIDNDGHLDAVYGPFWFAGPDYRSKKLIYKAFPQPREAYANHFFAWTYDFNGDRNVDVLTAGFPGTPAHVYQNPGRSGLDAPWPRHQVFDWVSNESPHFTNLVGDERPELVCTRDGYFGYVQINSAEPFSAWTFQPVSERIAPEKFGHGLGVGDVNGDGRQDILFKDGWFEQPADLKQGLWKLHPVVFAARGGAEMHAYDVDGDGDNDVITSLAAHDFGLSWHEQTPTGFKEHLIMGDRPAQNRYGLVFSELHSVQLADMDGDGLKDIVTGKTYWSHHKKSPMWDAGAVVYWFKLVRSQEGVDWIPMKADGASGIGRQVIVQDVNGDKLPDILCGGMIGGSVLLHRSRTVSAEEWQAAQPKPIELAESPPRRGEPAELDPVTGKATAAIEAETLTARATKGVVSRQDMQNFKSARWSGDAQLFWRGGEIGDRLEMDLTVAAEADYALETVFTIAPDYGTVQVLLDGRELGEPVDLYDFSKVATSGLIRHEAGRLEPGPHKLGFQIKGANPRAVQKYYLGIDFVRLVQKR